MTLTHPHITESITGPSKGKQTEQRTRQEFLDVLKPLLPQLISYTASWVSSYTTPEDITACLKSRQNINTIGEDFSIRHQNYTIINHTIKPLYEDYCRETKLTSNTNIPLGFVEYIIENYEVQDGVIKEKTNKVNSLRN